MLQSIFLKEITLNKSKPSGYLPDLKFQMYALKVLLMIMSSGLYPWGFLVKQLCTGHVQLFYRYPDTPLTTVALQESTVELKMQHSWIRENGDSKYVLSSDFP